MMKNRIAVLSLAGILSAYSLHVLAATSTGTGTTSSDDATQTRQPASPSTNADPDAGTLPKGADGGTTDSGPTPGGAKTGGADKVGGGSSSGGGEGGSGGGS
ncbi:hypothetical protein [Pseudomonas sp. PB3P13]